MSLPLSVDYFILYWNKELFAEEGRRRSRRPSTRWSRPPRSSPIPKEGTYGFVGRGLNNANVTLWTNFLLGYGGEFLDAKGNILTDGPEAIEATKLYQRLLTKPAPPGVAGFNWMESMASFLQGKVGMWIDGVGLAPPLEDPNTSRVVGKVGYAVMPSGPKGQYSATFGDGIGVTAGEQEQGSRLSLLPMGGVESAWARACCRPAAACRSATRSSTTRRCARA